MRGAISRCWADGSGSNIATHRDRPCALRCARPLRCARRRRRSARLGHKTAGGSTLGAARCSNLYPRSNANLTGHQHLRRKVIQHTPRQQILVVAFAGMEAAERPKVTEVQSCKNAAVTKVTIGQYLWEKPINQDIQLDCRHSAFPFSRVWAPSPNRLLIFGQKEDNSTFILAYSVPLSNHLFFT